MTELILKTEKRDNIGGASSKNLIKTGYLPIVVYGPEKKNIDLKVKYGEFMKIFQEAGENTSIILEVDGKKIPTFIHDTSKNPLTNQVIHADFYQFNKDLKLKSDIPLHFIGESNAVKLLGGMLVKDTDHLEVECLPSDMPHFVEVDLSRLNEIGDIIYVRDLAIDKNVEILNHEDQVIISVQAIKRQEEPVEAEKVEESVEAEKVEETQEKEE
jgi:large subunit ribosomal protein L25